MECAVCGESTVITMARGHDKVTECPRCGYGEHLVDGRRFCVINDEVYECGDATTIEGNLQAWRIWFAILAAREALRNEGSH